MTVLKSLDFLVREPNAEYREKAKAHLTSHQLADFRKCPILFWQKVQGLVPDEDRPAYILGRAAHMLILEGRERFDEEYAVGGPINARTGKPYGANTQAYADWAAAQGKPVITDDQFALIVNMAAGVRSHRLALDLLSDGIAEGVVRTEYCGVSCQARPDWFHPIRGIVDLKTCDDLTWFEADARRFQYAHQMAFYRAVLCMAAGDAFPVHVIAVEKKPPFRCGVWQISDQTLATCQRENEAAVDRLKQCKASNSWPTGYEEVRFFDYV
ncbi:MAG: PD-(D/E)XK nuclease-like domain-containing protein [Planctomycetota bacterium]